MLIRSLLEVTVLLSAPVIILTNGAVLAAFWRFHRLRTPSNTILTSLAAADFGFGFALVVAIACEEAYCNKCIPNSVIPLFFFSGAGLLSAALVALDRFTSVSQPLRYSHFVKNSYVHRGIVAVWSFALLSTVGLPIYLRTVFDPEKVILIVGFLLYIPCLIIALLSYGYIYNIARSHAKQIYSVEISLHSGPDSELRDQHTVGHGHRYSVTLALIIGSLVVCWTPILAVCISDVFWGSKIMEDRKWRLFILLPVVFASASNSFLYSFRSTEMRTGVVRLVETILGRSSRQSAQFVLLTKGEATSCASNVRLLPHSPSNVIDDEEENNGMLKVTTITYENGEKKHAVTQL